MYGSNVCDLNPIAPMGASDFWLQKLKELQSYKRYDD